MSKDERGGAKERGE
ncbi:hypothetical protein SOVF_195060, partial [Spinacia oleracea]